MRALAVHFDSTWDSTVAVENISDALSKLDIDLYTYVVDNNEYDDIYRSFLKAGVRDIETPTDIALAAVLNRAAEEHKIKYIFEGHSFRTEGVAPLSWFYIDGMYVKSVQEKFGKYPLKTFPNMYLLNQMRWMVMRGIEKIRPLYHAIDYIKSDAHGL